MNLWTKLREIVRAAPSRSLQLPALNPRASTERTAAPSSPEDRLVEDFLLELSPRMQEWWPQHWSQAQTLPWMATVEHSELLAMPFLSEAGVNLVLAYQQTLREAKAARVDAIREQGRSSLEKAREKLEAERVARGIPLRDAETRAYYRDLQRRHRARKRARQSSQSPPKQS